jgi:transcriptional regulator of met regulon
MGSSLRCNAKRLIMRLLSIIKIAGFEETGRQVKVYRDSETDEYVCKLFVYGKYDDLCTYFTENKEDAIGTARKMCECPFKRT